ncbi:class I adenylate-forming enzyme family protein [Streptomyces sp. NPDC059582]|uniref:class I adenylate-forming enzyme family protein n=1 Tax=Streptomyces sp. NPDC059582 TaxID=3346875 RepID=UPI0036C307AE
MESSFIADLFGPRFEQLTLGEWHDHVQHEIVTGSVLRRRALDKAEELRDRGLRPHQVAVIREATPISFVTNYLAAGLVGAVVMPMERGLPAHDEDRRLGIARPAFLLEGDHITDTGTADARQDLPSEVAQILFTGGTTGAPKAVLHTRAGLVSNISAIIKYAQYGPGDRVLGTLPLFHCYGVNWTALAPTLTGASVDAFGRLSTSAIAHVPLAPTAWPTVPAAVERLLRSPVMGDIDWSKLRFCLVGGAPTASDLSSRFMEHTGRPVLNAYGVTEATSFVCGPDLRTSNQGPGDVGAPVAEVEVREGAVHGQYAELELGGPSVMAGYLDDPEATSHALTEDGWLRTGDLFELTPQGTVALRGRLKNFINRGGEKIDPATVAAAVNQHPSVVEAYVFGYPDDRLGEIVACLVEPDGSASQDLEQEIRVLASELLAAYAVPTLIRIVPRLPRNAVGKVVPTTAQQLLLVAP